MKASSYICILVCLCLIGGCNSRTEPSSATKPKTTTTTSERMGATTGKSVSTTSTTNVVKTKAPIKTTKKAQTQSPATSSTTQTTQSSNNTGKQRATFRLEISGKSGGNPVSGETFPSDVKTYEDFQYAPDYGATIGITYDLHSTNTYAYSNEKVMAADPNAQSLANYMHLLQRCGYSLTDDIYLSGEKFTAFVNTKYNRTIAIRFDTKRGYVLILVK